MIEETHAALGLRVRVTYCGVPNERLPVLMRRVTLHNIGTAPLTAQVLDGLPQIVPFGLGEAPLKLMSRTMEAFAEIRHIEARLPFYKLKVEPSDKPEVQWIDGGYFPFTVQDGHAVPIIADPDLVFGADTSLRSPLAFKLNAAIDPSAGRRDTLTGCAFAQLAVSLAPGESTAWASYFGQAPDWGAASALRDRILLRPRYADEKQQENTALIRGLMAQFDLLAGPAQLGAYTRQAFLDNTLRGGQPVVIDGPRGPRVFHAFTRKHGDTERDYNFFELAPTCWSQGNANFRDVNQNRRSENFVYPGVDATNIETFFELMQLDGNNPLVIQAERFCLPAEQLPALLAAWSEARAPHWQALLAQAFSPGQLMEALLDAGHAGAAADALFEQVLGLADKLQEAAHGEGYWVDHWIYNLDLLDSHAALYPDRQRALLLERADFSYFDNDHVVQARSKKYVLRQDGAVRQSHAVVQDAGKTRLIAGRAADPQKMRSGRGLGPVFRTTLLAKIVSLLAVKSSLFDPFGVGLEMEAEKPGWCDALNGLPGLLGSSTHEAQALRRGLAFARQAVTRHLSPAGALLLPREVAELVQSVTDILQQADLQNFLPTWQHLATRREAFRVETRLGVLGQDQLLSAPRLLVFFSAVERVLAHGLAGAMDGAGLSVSYYIHEVTAFERLPATAPLPGPGAPAAPVFVAALRFRQKPVAAFLEGAVHALRAAPDLASA